MLFTRAAVGACALVEIAKMRPEILPLAQACLAQSAPGRLAIFVLSIAWDVEPQDLPALLIALVDWRDSLTTKERGAALGVVMGLEAHGQSPMITDAHRLADMLSRFATEQTS